MDHFFEHPLNFERVLQVLEANVLDLSFRRKLVPDCRNGLKIYVVLAFSPHDFLNLD